VIVNFAVEHKNSISIFREERLVPSLKIDDFQPDRAQSDSIATINAALIGPTMVQHIGSYTNTFSYAIARAMRKASDSAQLG